MSDDKNDDNPPNKEQNENNNDDKPNDNERNDKNGPGSSASSNFVNTENVDIQDVEQSDSEILNFFANYGRSEGTFFPYIPTTEAFVYMKIPPDGGYAWIILLISFINSVVIDGTMFCVGRILPDLIDDLKISSDTAALVVSIQIGLYYASGPISSILVNKLGFRAVAIIGGSLAIFGNIVGSFSNDILYLMIFFGVIVGFGCGLSILAVTMIVSFYFEKYRSIACGICSAGTGFGILIFSPLNNYIVTISGWRNVLRIHSGICFLTILLSIFYHPVKLTKIGKYFEQPLKEEETIDSLNSIEIAYDRYSKFYTPHSPEREGSIVIGPTSNQTNPTSKTSTNYPQSVKAIDNLLSKCCICWTRRRMPVKDKEPSIIDEKKVPAVSNSNVPQRIVIDVAPLDREDIFYAGNPNYEDTANKLDDENITVLPGKEKQAIAINYTISVMRTLAPDQPQTTAKKCLPHCTLSAKMMGALNLLFDPRLLHSKEFGVIFCGSFLYFLGGNIPYLYLTSHVEIPAKYSNLLLSIIGFLNTILRITAGVLAFSFQVNPLYIAGIPLVLSGALTFLVGFVGKDVIWFQFLYSSVFATGSAFCSAFRSIIIVQLLGLDKLTNAYGFTALGMGIASFIGTNIGGIIQVNTGKLDYAFGFAGIVIVISGLLHIFLQPIVNFLRRDENITKKVRFTSFDGNT